MKRLIVLILFCISILSCNPETKMQKNIEKLKQVSSFSELSGGDEKNYFYNIDLIVSNNRLDFFSIPEKTKTESLQLSEKQKIFYNTYAGVLGEVQKKYEPDLIYESEPRRFTWGISYCRKKQPWFIDWDDKAKEFFIAGSGSYDVISNIDTFEGKDYHYSSGPSRSKDKIKEQYLLNEKYYNKFNVNYIRPEDVKEVITNIDIKNILLVFIYNRNNEMASIVSEKLGLTIEGWDEPDHYNMIQIKQFKKTNQLDNLNRLGSNIVCMLHPYVPIKIYQNCFISEDIVSITKENKDVIVIELITRAPSKITLMFTLENNKLKLFKIRNFIDTE